jgi:tetratricopeptide (TPR) repeat protein
MTSHSRRIPFLIASLGVTCVAVAGASLAADGRHPTAAATAGAPAVGTGTAPAAGASGDLSAAIARAQSELRAVPGDWQTWATLGLDYVQQAKITVDPSYYPKAQGALARSLQLNHRQNYIAMAGQAALASARHDFRAALSWARRGLHIDPHSAVLYGALCDAQTQLGRYAAAAGSARRMELLSPGGDATARISYADELQGRVGAARGAMLATLRDAATPADVGFARYYLAELAGNSGHPAVALRQIHAGLSADPTSAALLEGRAKAEAALGRFGPALRDFAAVVNRVPQPGYVLEYGELLQSLGRGAAARQQYDVFRTEEKLFTANGVALDTDETLFEADHGNVRAAVAAGRSGLQIRPFVEMHDAYGWALHTAGRAAQALRQARAALATGMRSALFRFHLGMIDKSLGRRAAARANLASALRINPHFNPLLAPVARRALQQLGGTP